VQDYYNFPFVSILVTAMLYQPFEYFEISIFPGDLFSLILTIDNECYL